MPARSNAHVGDLAVFLVFIGALFLAGSHMSNTTIGGYSELSTISAIILGVTTLTYSCRVFSQNQTVYVVRVCICTRIDLHS
jgi:hypothetical protein